MTERNQLYPDFGAYDRLPVAIRRVIQGWPQPIDAANVLQVWRFYKAKNGWRPETYAREMQRELPGQLRDLYREWPGRHPLA